MIGHVVSTGQPEQASSFVQKKYWPTVGALQTAQQTPGTVVIGAGVIGAGVTGAGVIGAKVTGAGVVGSVVL